MSVINLRNATLEIADGADHKLQLKIGNGNVTFDEKRTIEYIKDRGRLDDVREGEEQPMDVRFDIQWEKLTALNTDTVPTPEDALKRRGKASTWVSSAADPCQPYAVDIIITDIPDCPDDIPERIVLPDFRWTSLAHDPKASNIACTGSCNAKEAVVTRGTIAT